MPIGFFFKLLWAFFVQFNHLIPMPKPPSRQPYVAPDPLLTIFRKFLVRILVYPYTIIKKYNNYNIRLGDMANLLKEQDKEEIVQEEIGDLRKTNGKLIMTFIYFPILVGFICSSLSINSHSFEYKNYWGKITKPTIDVGIVDKVKTKFSQAKIIITECPYKKNDGIFILYGYLVALLGARFLSMNPVFKEEDHKSTVFGSLGYVDAEGEPWQITWTPDAIMIICFNCDPYLLCDNSRFWSSINFPPSLPTVSKETMNKFIVTRAYELSPKMTFVFDEKIKI
jgi:hypothetical protein